MIRQIRPAAITGAALAVVVAIALTGCQPDPEPTPSLTVTTASPTTTATPSPGPTADDAGAAKQANIDAAKARYEDYIAAINQIAIDGGADGYDRIAEFLGTPELQTTHQAYWAQVVEKGTVQKGETVIAAMTVTEYVGDPLATTTQQVRMDVCLDNSTMDTVRPDGTSTQQEGWPKRVVQKVLMQTQPDGRWTVNEAATTDPVQEC